MKLKKIMSTVLAGVMLFGAGLSGIASTEYVEAAPKARVSVHDPSVFKDKSGTYYVFGSHIEAARTRDLQNWTRFTNGYATTNNKIFGNLSSNLKKAFAWAGENLEDCVGGFAVWAPDVIYNPDYVNSDGSKGAYMMYFCTTSTYMRSVLAYAVSQNPEGPYQFVDTLIYSGFTSNDSYATSSTKNVNRKYTSTNIDELISAGKVTYNKNWFSGTNFNNNLYPNAIDPTIYYDTNGKMYMTYGSWSGGIFTIELDKKTGKCIHPKTGTTSDGRMVDSYFGTKISGGYFKSGEGPFMEYNPETGYYYLWVTYGGLTATGGYNMRVFRSKNPTGPFVDAAGRSAVLAANTNLDSIGLKVMGNYQFSSLSTAYMAGGHNSVLRDDDGQWYLLFHTRFNRGNEFHEVRVHSMHFSEDGWPVVTPYEYSGDRIAPYGYEPADLAGNYEFINHGNDTSATIHKYSNITLNSNGTISGSASGTWSQFASSSAATITVGGKTYKGHFIATQDESGKKVMTFTAVGSNNQTIWGAKTSTYTGTPRNQGATEFADGSTFRLNNVNSGLYMQVADASASNGANVQQWGSDGTGVHDIWKLFSAGDGYYYIASCLGDGGTYVLDVAGKKTDNGTNVDIYQHNSGTNQQFMLTKNSDGSYKLRTRVSGGQSAVEIVDGLTTSGANVQQWEVNGANCQDWILEPVADPGCKMDVNYVYKFENANSDFVMDVVDGVMEEKSNVQQWEDNGADCQKWILKDFGKDNYYWIRSFQDTGYALKAEGGEVGSNISLSAYSSKDSSQLFRFTKNLDGTYSIITHASKDTCLVEVGSASTEYGGNIIQWEPTSHDCQRWNVVTSVTTTTTAATTTTTTTTTTVTTTEKLTTTEKATTLNKTTTNPVTTSKSTTTVPVTTTPVVTEPTTLPDGELYGDVNLDNEVDIADIVAINMYLLNPDQMSLDIKAKANSDCERNNVIDATDSTMIMNYVAMIIDKVQLGRK